MKIAILNQPLANRGDEAAHKAFVRALSKALPDVQIDVLFIVAKKELVDAMDVHEKNVRYIILPSPYRLLSKVQKASLLLGIPEIAFLHPSLRRFRKILNSYDKVICAPGGICMGGFMDWGHIWQLLIAKQLKKQIFYWGRSIGPFSEDSFRERIFKKYSYKLLRYFSYISLRDTKSIAIAKEAGIEPDEVVDSAFLETPTEDIPEKISFELKNNDYVVFVPNELTWHFRYKAIPQDRIDEFYLNIIHLIEKKYPGAKIVMLPQTYNSFVNDYLYFNRLKMLSNNSNILIVDENQSSDIQQTIIAGAKLVIGARYHSIVFAINNDVPFISLSYEHKMKGLLETLNFTANLIEIQDIFEEDECVKYNEAINKCNELMRSYLKKSVQYEAKNIVTNGFSNIVKILRQEHCFRQHEIKQ